MRLLPGQLFSEQTINIYGVHMVYIIGYSDIDERGCMIKEHQMPLLRYRCGVDVCGTICGWSESYIASHNEIVEYFHKYHYACLDIDDTIWVNEI